MTLFGFGKDSARRTAEAVGNAPAPALSKQDYEHTTTPSPDSTALIPTVRDQATDEAPAPKPPEAPTPSPVSTRRGRTELRLVRIDPFSVTRLTFVVSVALMIVVTVAVALFWLMLEVTGVWGEINESVASLLSDDSASFDITDYVGFTRMVGGTLVLSGINVVLLTALATIGAHLYNLAAALLGGIDVTLTDD